MNVLIVNGSNRPNGHGVHLARSAARGLGAEQLEEIQPAGLHVEPCRGCCRCLLHHPKDSLYDCPIEDDVDATLEKMLQADCLIINTPVYGGGVPGPFKMLLDRMGRLMYFTRMDRLGSARLPADPRKGYISIVTFAAPRFAYWLFFNVGRRMLRPLGRLLGRKHRLHLSFSETQLRDGRLPPRALAAAERLGRRMRAILSEQAGRDGTAG